MALLKSEITVLRFGDRRLPRPLRSLRCLDVDHSTSLDEAIGTARRVVVVGADADLAAVLSRLLRTERLEVEVAHVGPRPLDWLPNWPRRWFSARRAVRARAQRVPLIRDDTGTVLVGSARWLPPEGSAALHGEAVVDETVLFDGDVTGVRIEPTATMPGLRARVVGAVRSMWVTGRAAQLGTTGARVVRDGIAGKREVKRSTFYRHTTGWLRVR